MSAPKNASAADHNQPAHNQPDHRRPADTTLGELRSSGHRHRTVKAELRANLLDRLAHGEPTFVGIVGFDDTVLPELERAILAGHDVVLLGERGQGKTRLIRSLVELLDEWTPVVTGSEINDHPYAPVSVYARDVVRQRGEDTPVTWIHRSERYGEKLATPDTSVGDLIGDVDPVKVAQGRTLGDPETIHFGLIPRTNRGVIAINELPDLAERIQVALFNVLEERDLQVRGYTLRLPLDVLVVASANPEDYTNRGRIVTPLKDRFGAEIRTHYPRELSDEVALIEQEAELRWPDSDQNSAPVVPVHLVEIVARYTRAVRQAQQVDSRSGVSARFAIAGLETLAASAVRRAAICSEPPVARVCDLPSLIPASRGKVEFEDVEEGRELEILDHLLRQATAATFRARLAGLDLSGLQSVFDTGRTVAAGDTVSAANLLHQLGPISGLGVLLERTGIPDGAESPGLAAAAVEFAMEGLYLNRRLAKDSDRGKTIYGS